MDIDEQYMRRALDLARKGLGLASPGAMVGAVVVRGGEVLGEGFYTWEGLHHAEIQALESAGDRARGATLYLTLEPCAHHGRTPPCARAILEAGVGRIVVAMEDPNPQVSGRGLEILRQAGVQVDSGLFESDARRINEAFIHWIQNARPFGVLKVAMSLDGKIATASGESQWITSEESRRRGHLIRHSADALLTGSGTILQDDPLLTDRSGKQRRRPLIRAVIDRRGRLNLNHRIFSFPGVLLYTDIPHFELPPDHEVIRGRSALSEVVADLADRDVQTLMLECGPDMAFEAIRHGVIDKIVVFVSPQIIGGREIPAFGSEGARALSDAIGIENWDVERVGPDLMITGYVHRDN